MYTEINQFDGTSAMVSRSLYRTFADEFPQDFMNFVDSELLHGSEPINTLLEPAVYTLVGDNETKERINNANWLMAKVPPENRTYMAGRIANSLAASGDVDGAFLWLDNHSNIDSEQVKVRLIEGLAFEDMDLAQNKIESLKEESYKIDSSYLVYRRLSFQYPERAEAFLKDSPYKTQIE